MTQLVRTFVFHWLDKKTTTSSGVDVADAARKAGIQPGALAAMDYYEEVKLPVEMDRPPLRMGAQFCGTVATKLRDGGSVHSLLIAVDAESGREVGRLPVDELRPRRYRSRNGARSPNADGISRNDQIYVRVIHVHNKQEGRFILSERAFYFYKILDRIDSETGRKNGWREECPEPDYWSFTKGRLRAYVYFANHTIVFRRSPRKAAA
jgi:hypothetical protein